MRVSIYIVMEKRTRRQIINKAIPTHGMFIYRKELLSAGARSNNVKVAKLRIGAILEKGAVLTSVVPPKQHFICNPIYILNLAVQYILKYQNECISRIFQLHGYSSILFEVFREAWYFHRNARFIWLQRSLQSHITVKGGSVIYISERYI